MGNSQETQQRLVSQLILWKDLLNARTRGKSHGPTGFPTSTSHICTATRHVHGSDVDSFYFTPPTRAKGLQTSREQFVPRLMGDSANLGSDLTPVPISTPSVHRLGLTLTCCQSRVDVKNSSPSVCGFEL